MLRRLIEASKTTITVTLSERLPFSISEDLNDKLNDGWSQPFARMGVVLKLPHQHFLIRSQSLSEASIDVVLCCVASLICASLNLLRQKGSQGQA